MGWVVVPVHISCWIPGEDCTTGTGLTLKVKSVGEEGEQPSAAGIIWKITGSRMLPELESDCRISPDPDMVEGSGVIVEALPEAVQLNVVMVSVPGTDDESATWALVPEQIVTGGCVAGTTLGMGFTVTVCIVGEAGLQFSVLV